MHEARCLEAWPTGKNVDVRSRYEDDHQFQVLVAHVEELKY